ncbi:glycosyltransferase [filamentous cyanobacterium LEGE 11480]|uniref:Glycosyltransferase n=1 Tax=Romeriopsis navalis LEGE 11480 TaxID=2777977 RepID=A0A928VMH8_9CYAN|nr:glycosyltransferase [Romeriopsis navalis]MBE9029396.1 glycosyltransferase [Romeriopsis navalis LEGE 11480]
MRRLYFLVPGTTGKFYCGGLFAELKTLKIAQQVCTAEVVTYRQREADTLFLDDLLAKGAHLDAIFVVSWGFDVPKLLKRLKAQQVIYHAHSAHYGFRLPANVPIVTVSRNTMGYWGQLAPNSLIFHLPNEISPEFSNQHQTRDIDVLVQARKSSEYLLKQLIPALQSQCNVYVIDHFVDNLGELFNRSQVYLYDSAEYWAQQGVTEGFGLPPMEAMASGCHVFSSVNNALADYLDPGFNCHKIAGYAMEYDLHQIMQRVQQQQTFELPAGFLAPYRVASIAQRLETILTEINTFFDLAPTYQTLIPDLTPNRLRQLRMKTFWQKVQKKLLKSGK